MMTRRRSFQGLRNPARGFGVAAGIAAVLLALAFMGCPTEPEPETEPGPEWGKIADWDGEDGGFELGTATAAIDGTNGRYQETALGNLIADGIAEYARQSSGEKVDFALHNGKDLKDTSLAAGKITNTDIFNTIGTDTLYLVTYTGQEITDLIDIFVNSNTTTTWKANGIVLVSKEVSYSVTPDEPTTNPPHATNIKINGTSIDLTATYRVAVGNFIGATTASQNRFPEGTEKTDLGPTKLSEAVAQYIYAQGTIDPPALGRITGEPVPVIPPAN